MHSMKTNNIAALTHFPMNGLGHLIVLIPRPWNVQPVGLEDILPVEQGMRITVQKYQIDLVLEAGNIRPQRQQNVRPIGVRTLLDVLRQVHESIKHGSRAQNGGVCVVGIEQSTARLGVVLDLLKQGRHRRGPLDLNLDLSAGL